MPRLGARSLTVCVRSAMVATRKSSSHEMKRASWASSCATRRARRWRATSVPSLHIYGSPARQGSSQALRWPRRWHRVTPASRSIAKPWPSCGTSLSRISWRPASQVYAGVLLSSNREPEPAKCEGGQKGQIEPRCLTRRPLLGKCKKSEETTRLARSQKQPSSVSATRHGSGRNSVPGRKRPG